MYIPYTLNQEYFDYMNAVREQRDRLANKFFKHWMLFLPMAILFGLFTDTSEDAHDIHILIIIVGSFLLLEILLLASVSFEHRALRKSYSEFVSAQDVVRDSDDQPNENKVIGQIFKVADSTYLIATSVALVKFIEFFTKFLR